MGTSTPLSTPTSTLLDLSSRDLLLLVTKDGCLDTSSLSIQPTRLSQRTTALGYTGDDMQLLCAVDDGARFNGSVFQKVNDATQVGVQLAWDKGSSNTSFGLASKYKIDDDSSLAVKLGNNGSVG